jgi:adenylyltransferase/sulfurtransferase
MPQVGSIGQRKLLDAKVLIVGAGVGTIGIVDFDAVDVTNLQRQILHYNDDIGTPKVESAAATLKAYNPDTVVITHEEPLTSDNAFEIMKDYDIIVNGADNFAARYLVNDAAYLSNKPLVDGSILLFDGMTTVFKPGQGCYRCLFPTPPPPGEVPSCAEAGVLGMLPGLVGTIQATETTKLILDVGESLSGRLLLIDALDMDFRTVKLRRNPECPLCGDNPTVTELIDYEIFCGVAVTGD